MKPERWHALFLRLRRWAGKFTSILTTAVIASLFLLVWHILAERRLAQETRMVEAAERPGATRDSNLVGRPGTSGSVPPPAMASQVLQASSSAPPRQALSVHPKLRTAPPSAASKRSDADATELLKSSLPDPKTYRP